MTKSLEEAADIEAYLAELRAEIGDKPVGEWLEQGAFIGRCIGFVKKSQYNKIFNLVQVANYLNIPYARAKKYLFDENSNVRFLDYVPERYGKVTNRDLCIAIGIDRSFVRGVAECIFLESLYPHYNKDYTVEQIAEYSDSNLESVKLYLPKLQTILSTTQSNSLYEKACKDSIEKSLQEKLKWEGTLKELPAAELEGKVYALAVFAEWSYSQIAECLNIPEKNIKSILEESNRTPTNGRMEWVELLQNRYLAEELIIQNCEGVDAKIISERANVCTHGRISGRMIGRALGEVFILYTILEWSEAQLAERFDNYDVTAQFLLRVLQLIE